MNSITQSTAKPNQIVGNLRHPTDGFCRQMVPMMTQLSQPQSHPFIAREVPIKGTSGPSPGPVPCPDAHAVSARDARLRKHADYQRVYKATRKQFSASMTWFFAARDAAATSSPQAVGTGPRVGLTVGKVIGKAHERNRIKRRMREAVRHHLHELPAGVDLILHPRRSVMTMEFMKLDAEILRIFRQAAAQVKTPARTSRPSES